MEMNEFISLYLFILVVGAIGFVLFWGTVIFFVVRFFKSNNGLTRQQKLAVASSVMGVYSGRGGPYEPGPKETEARSTLAEAGIDPDR
jgi:hypothetical protein